MPSGVCRGGAQWELGDLSREVETTYGGRELERDAEGIGVEERELHLSARAMTASWTEALGTVRVVSRTSHPWTQASGSMIRMAPPQTQPTQLATNASPQSACPATTVR